MVRRPRNRICSFGVVFAGSPKVFQFWSQSFCFIPAALRVMTCK